ncbi:MAG: three-Cys-motif partner protein TcmP [Neptuniibacter sp.]
MAYDGHKFGGHWTEEKLRFLNEYINAYTIALKNQPFDLHYIDGFAGTGERTVTEEKSLFNDEERRVVFDGSVKLALDISRQFDHYHFIDLNPIHIKQLNEIKQQYKNTDISIYQSDANELVIELCHSIDWKKNRAVLFLDPYGMEVDWETLSNVSNTKAIDMWFLFPLSGLFRNAPNKKSSLDQGKVAALNRILGTDEWHKAFYAPKPIGEMGDLFADPIFSEEPEEYRQMNVEELEAWVTKRLSTIFPYVLEPITLKRNNIPMFTLFFAVSNPSHRALGLAKKISSAIREKLL